MNLFSQFTSMEGEIVEKTFVGWDDALPGYIQQLLMFLSQIDYYKKSDVYQDSNYLVQAIILMI